MRTYTQIDISDFFDYEVCAGMRKRLSFSQLRKFIYILKQSEVNRLFLKDFILSSDVGKFRIKNSDNLTMYRSMESPVVRRYCFLQRTEMCTVICYALLKRDGEYFIKKHEYYPQSILKLDYNK